jgi:hypothetical protein
MLCTSSKTTIAKTIAKSSFPIPNEGGSRPGGVLFIAITSITDLPHLPLGYRSLSYASRFLEYLFGSSRVAKVRFEKNREQRLPMPKQSKAGMFVFILFISARSALPVAASSCGSDTDAAASPILKGSAVLSPDCPGTENVSTEWECDLWME